MVSEASAQSWKVFHIFKIVKFSISPQLLVEKRKQLFTRYSDQAIVVQKGMKALQTDCHVTSHLTEDWALRIEDCING